MKMSLKDVTEVFVNSAGFFLLAFALAMFAQNWASAGFASPLDPLFRISMRNVFWAAGGLAAIVALTCLFIGKGHTLKMLLVLWLAVILLTCQFGFRSSGAHNTQAYLYTLGDTFDVSAETTMRLLGGLVLYLLVGSAGLLLCSWVAESHHAKAGYLKMYCPACGGHVEFLPTNLGQTIPCPHCQASVMLRKPENLKISCYFCEGHIEFPPHAIGTKMACPHCKMDITLKEPTESLKA